MGDVGEYDSTMGDVAIRAEHLSREFHGVRAVDDLSFEVPVGIVFGFLGPNGSGKTTTIRLLLGLLEPSVGEAAVLGHDVRREAEAIRLRAGALLEYPGLYDRLTAEANLDFYGRIWHMPANDRRTRIRALLTQFGLWERRDERIGGWSRGMRQKLGIARALMHRPALVFLDEPTAGLDPIAAAALVEDLEALVAGEGVTIFLTTHNLHEAEKLCRRVGVIRSGHLLAVGTTEDLVRSTSGSRVEVIGRGFCERTLHLLEARPEVAGLGLRNGSLWIDLRDDAAVAPLVSLMVGAGVAIEEVRRERASLEEAFISLMEREV